MNIKETYRRLTTPREQLAQQASEADKAQAESNFKNGLTAQQHIEWMQHPVTRELIEYLRSRSVLYTAISNSWLSPSNEFSYEHCNAQLRQSSQIQRTYVGIASEVSSGQFLMKEKKQ